MTSLNAIRSIITLKQVTITKRANTWSSPSSTWIPGMNVQYSTTGVNEHHISHHGNQSDEYILVTLPTTLLINYLHSRQYMHYLRYLINWNSKGVRKEHFDLKKWTSNSFYLLSVALIYWERFFLSCVIFLYGARDLFDMVFLSTGCNLQTGMRVSKLYDFRVTGHG